MTILGSESRSYPAVSRAVPQWSGREVRALREARRMSVRQFAAHLGVSDRMVSKWEAGGLAIRPRPVNQAALDTSLAQSGADVRSRFAAMTSGRPVPIARQRGEVGAPRLSHLLSHPEDGKLMTLIGSGPFRRGDDPVDQWLTGFYVDIHPVTLAEYVRFLAATGAPAPLSWPASWPADGQPPELADHPVVGVGWDEAQAYAAWAAKVLPTGAQWEKAARGPAGATFPWGDHASPARANVRESRIGATTPVDRYDNGVSPYGVQDLCGNAAEWCAGDAGPEVRGGGYAAPLHAARPANGVPVPPAARRPDVGFRCVVDAEAMLELLSI